MFAISSSHLGISSSQVGPEAEQVVEAVTDADSEQVQDGLDTLNDLRSLQKKVLKPSAKSKKRSTDRKRKGSSWYNVCLTEIRFLPLPSYSVSVLHYFYHNRWVSLL